ncbi:MAG: PEP/pyruvate-binding domain-containing protein [Clostridia bacterium]|nr:PEP/pyruvate-binding domain-containing protein [Clostridia bacterium]MDD4387533.1 PEP/pyruvate-binding domain-containing protein [Clostridia bacterium]
MKNIYYLNDESDINIVGNKFKNLQVINDLKIPTPYACLVLQDITKKDILNILLDFEKPTIVSIRSSPNISMPGMLETILNVGFNDYIADKLLLETNNFSFVYSNYLNFVEKFVNLSCNINKLDYDKLDNVDYINLINKYKQEYLNKTKTLFPEDIETQIYLSIKCIINSKYSKRCSYYIKANNIEDKLSIGVIIQKMVFGNISDNSMSGVVFSRNPITGENMLYGGFLYNSLGENIVNSKSNNYSISDIQNTEQYSLLEKYSKELEKYFKKVQDIEFCIENKKLYILQCRDLKIAKKIENIVLKDMIRVGIISKNEVDIDDLGYIEVFDEKVALGKVIGHGIPVSNGVLVGKIIFKKDDILDETEKYILVKEYTTPDDIELMNKVHGIITTKGGSTSHAAIISRNNNKVCITGISNMIVNNEYVLFNNNTLVYGDTISIDGNFGNVYMGEIPIIKE